MSEFKLDELKKHLNDTGVYTDFFDVTRLVDAQSGRVIELNDGKILETIANCVDALGSSERCKNCTSIRALYTNEQVVKLEYAKGSVLLIVSQPVVIDNRTLVIEMVKDITASMTVDIKDEYRADEVSVIIDKFNKLATTDKLTGLMNRRYIDEKLPNILETCKRLDKSASVAMVDIDFFKKINDTYSHQAGDFILTGISAIFMSFIRRESDFVARYGGEEFLFCFPGTALETCHHICERIRESIEKHVFKYNQIEIPVTISIGAADSRELTDPSQEALIALADKRLYEAKASGRNKVV